MRRPSLISFFSILMLCGLQGYGQVLPMEDTVYETDVDEEYMIKDVDTNLYLTDHPVATDSVSGWKGMKAFAYTRYIDSVLKEQQKKDEGSTSTITRPRTDKVENFFDHGIVSVSLWILAAAFVSFILYRLFLADAVFKKSHSSKEGPQTTQEVEEEVVRADSDLDRLISVASAAGNYRSAVRYQYLKSLYRLAEKGHVEMTADKTNYQYVQEIRDKHLRNELAALTLNYEYVWYGEFQIEQVIYRKLENAFSAFNQKI